MFARKIENRHSTSFNVKHELEAIEGGRAIKFYSNGFALRIRNVFDYYLYILQPTSQKQG